jgi:Domain of unknown function (DUF4345)
MDLARAILWFLALGFAGFGTAYACWPAAMASLTDIALPSATARVDFMATYGGFQLGFAVFLGICQREIAGDPAEQRSDKPGPLRRARARSGGDGPGILGFETSAGLTSIKE